jgi:transposase
MQSPYDILAVDVSKDSLQIHTSTKSFALPYDPAGLRKLLATSRKLPNPLVVCEATGGYERTLPETLCKASIPCRRVNPALIRGFANSEGIKAKNDRIDAKTIYRFALEKKLKAHCLLPDHKQALADLLDRRGHFTEQLAREKNRLQKAPAIIAKSLRDSIAFIQKQIEKIESSIRRHLASHTDLLALVKIFLGVNGVGEVTAWSLAAYLSEIASISRNRLVALAGIAPFDNDSGRSSSKRHIFGGRAKIRRCLYMAAHTAATHNPVIKAYVKGLRSRGKPYKCAIVAAMRKLLIHLQSLLRKSPLLSLAQ